MFKRANKITALLVAAASVMSIVPAMASDVKKVDSQDGTVYDAVAYKDGKFYVDGSVADKDEAVYYVSNGEYKALDDVDTGSSFETYGTKYINVEDGNNFVDLETGKVTDDSIKDDAEDDTASALRKHVKSDTDGRYVEGSAANESEAIQDLSNAQLAGNKFGEIWYGVSYKNKNAANGYTANDVAGTLNVYTDVAGNYIDADYNLGKIKVTTTEGGASKTVTVENTNDSYDAATTADDVKTTVSGATVIGQDKDYIYRTATVTINTTNSVVKTVNGLAVDGATAFTQTATTVSFPVIQKISKAQASDDVDGAKYAKTVTTYVISGDDGSSKALLTDYNKFTVVGGKIVAYNVDTTGTVGTQTVTLKSKNGYYYTDLAGSASEDVESVNSTNAVQVDADGNLWRLNGGYIYQWNNDEDWDKVYKVDGSLNELSVYDKNDMVAWNEDDEVYSVIGGKDATTTPVTPVTPVVTAGWAKAADGTWTYAKADGTKATGWLQDGATWYYLKADGVMATGWQNVGGTWYYLAGSGAMVTGWVQDGANWYYLAGSGAMLSNTTVDGYVLGASGAWVR